MIGLKPTMRDLLDRFKDEVFSSLNCIGIGKIESYDQVTRLARLSMAYKARKEGVDQQGKAYSDPVDYPALVDCPVFRLTGGKKGFHVPIEVGDTALILFNDVDMDTFISSKNIKVPSTNRMHSFSDAIALVGIENEARYLGDEVGFFDDEASLTIKAGKISMKNNSQDMLAVMLEMLKIIKELAPISASPGNPSGPNPADGAKITLLENKVKGLFV